MEELISGQISSWGELLENLGCMGYADGDGIYHIEKIETHEEVAILDLSKRVGTS